MSRHDSLIIKETHRGLLYEDGVFRELLGPGRYQIPRAPSKIAGFFGIRAPKVEVVLVDIRGRDRTIVVQDQLTADGVSISSTFVVQFRVENPIAALHEVKSFEERLYAEAQTIARRILRGMSLEEVLIARDEIGDEILREILGSAKSYGLVVSAIDFKDLIVPDKFKKMMNRAMLTGRLHQVEEEDETSFNVVYEDDSDDLIIANARIDRSHGEPSDEEAGDDSRPEKLAIRPHAVEARGPGVYANSLEFALRRRQS
jgi:regulator of protease activity HflC (stomatin/prohibitin superfamily)